VQQQQAFRNAMLRGNANAAFWILEQGGESAFGTEIYRDQLEYRLPRMMNVARECRDRDLRAGDGKTAMYCNGFVFSTGWILGNAQAVFQALAWHRKYGAAIWAKVRPGEKFPLAFPLVGVVKLARSVPAYSTEIASADPVTLPYVAAEANTAGSLQHEISDKETGGAGRSSRPVVGIDVNGHHVEALIDTGDPRTLIVSSSQAKALGLKPLVAGLPHSIGRFGQSPVPAEAAGWSLVATLTLGPLRVRNVMAIVIPDRYNGENPGARIGLPLLAMFGGVAFERSSMVVNSPAVPCNYSVPITYASQPNMDGALVFPAEANGKTINAMIDTGSVDRLIVGPELIPKSAVEVAAANGGARNWKSTRTRIRIAKTLVADGPALMYAGLPKMEDADFGYPQRWLKSVRFDFSAMSICLTPRESPAWDAHSPSRTLITASPLASSPQTAPQRAFRVPKLNGMDLHPGDAVVDRYIPPPPPWLHVKIHCAVVNGNVYIDGTVTGNYGHPIAGAVIYQGHGEVVTGKVTSGRSGQIHAVEPLTGGPVAAPPNLSKFPMSCVAPSVKVGSSSRVMQTGQKRKAGH
jgi:predicted aspartyl protease